MMDVEVLGCHTSYWPLVGSDEGKLVLEAQIPPICEDKVPQRRLECTPVQWAVVEHL